MAPPKRLQRKLLASASGVAWLLVAATTPAAALMHAAAPGRPASGVLGRRSSRGPSTTPRPEGRRHAQRSGTAPQASLEGVSSSVGTVITDVGSVAAGCVVTAPAREFSHFLRKASIFVVEHSAAGSLGVNLESKTMLTIGEAAPGVVDGPLAANALYMGGEYGGRGARAANEPGLHPIAYPLWSSSWPADKALDILRLDFYVGALMLHAHADLEGAVAIGDSGVYAGGVAAAARRVAAGELDAAGFKFFFNVAKWGPGDLGSAVADGRWQAHRVPPAVVLRQDPQGEPDDLWTALRRRASDDAAEASRGDDDPSSS